MNTILSLDHTILLYITTHLRTSLCTDAMRVFTMLGNGGMIWILLSLFLLARPKTRRCGITMLASLLIGLLLGEGILKHVICRPRPFMQYHDITILIPAPSTFSFPSGHTLSSFSAATALFGYYHRTGIGMYCMAALIAFSRLYLGVHYPSDVLAGLLLGVAVGIFSYWLINGIMNQLHYARLR